MSQQDVFDWLKRKRLSGDDGFFSAEEIRRALGLRNGSVYKQLSRLYDYGFVEAKVFRYGKRVFAKKRRRVVKYRLCEKYCGGET